MAILWSDGNHKDKVVELYDMLQDNNQKSIGATDKDFKVTIFHMFDLAGYTIDQNQSIVTDKETESKLTQE